MKEQKLRPLKDNLLVQLDPKSIKSKGGIYIPETARSIDDKAIVLEVGPDVDDLKKGDHILIGKMIGAVVKNEATDKQLIIPRENIIALITEDE